MHHNRMKRSFAFLLTMAMLLSLCLGAAGAQYPCVGFAARELTVTRSASATGETLYTVPAGDAVYITGDSGDYYIIEYDGQPGYAAKSAVRLAGEVLVNNPDGAWLGAYTALRQGDEGQLVRELQSALIEAGFLSGSADGKYGQRTAQAVADFQAVNGLNNSGYADIATQGTLYETKITNSRGKAVSVTILPSVDGLSVSSGKTGAPVESLQAALTDLGYYTGKIDGKCASGTVSAIKRFQTKNGLQSTGVADPETLTLLYSGEAVNAKATATPKPTVTPVPPVIGWENGQSASKKVYPFDTTTLDAVNLRQRARTSSQRLLTIPAGATVSVKKLTGDWAQLEYFNGKRTFTGYAMAKYIDIPAIYYGGKELASDRQAQLKYTGISAGASGTNVSTLQEALHELGFYDGDITGIFDTETAQAVKDFQRKNGLLQTGAVSAELQKLIYEGKPVNAKGKKVSVAVLPPIAGIAMQQGDAGYQVEELQAALIDLGYLEGAISGTYDAKTTAAVKKLQKASGLKADGIAGAATLKQIERYLTTPTPKITVVTPTPAPITADNVIVIQKGTRGLVVTRLQERLVALGYYDIEPDGIFNANDVTALKAFQKKNGIKADGIAGLDTQVRLYSDAAVSAWATATPKPAATPKPDLTARLEIGSSGTQVSLLQARLTTLGYFTATMDGRFGTATALAVAEFQSVNGLSADGIAGAQTLKALYASTAKSAIVITPTATPKPSFTALRIGDRGSEVRAVQAMLIELDYLTGAADGIYGTKTYLAVRAFQRDNRLSADGVVGTATYTLLVNQSGSADTGSTGNGGNNVSGTTFKAPQASEVRFADWYRETRDVVRKLPNAIIYDYTTGLHYNVHMFSFGKHCDAEPVTASDTAIMRQIMGADNWTPHAVWVILSDGRVYMASTHSKGHTVDHNASNDLQGHICIHFPREMSDTEKRNMPYATRHQNEILRGWEETQSMIGY